MILCLDLTFWANPKDKTWFLGLPKAQLICLSNLYSHQWGLVFAVFQSAINQETSSCLESLPSPPI